ncbi:MAG TPA: HesA/MoeB/ThiF family protein [Burkholderiales bacterium]|nr:HesA/MoeB/ThiF family protein [Burkholderiales bacterium]
MNDNQLIRYSRHILLPQIGIEGQEKLLHSHALIIGAGGLGSPAALYLAASGVGKITICDGEKVDLTNLQRQIVHHTLSVGTPKTQSARNTLGLINPEVTVVEVSKRVTREDILDLVRNADVVLDASDNFATRHAVNRACVAHRKPLVSGAGVRFDGQVAVFDLRETSSPCYHCLFPEAGEVEETRCAVMGVFAPLTGIIGTIQAAEALKLLTGAGETLNGRLLLVDALSMEWRSIKLAKDPQCTVCDRKAQAVNA